MILKFSYKCRKSLEPIRNLLKTNSNLQIVALRICEKPSQASAVVENVVEERV